MVKKLISISAIILCVINLEAQQDTLWFDAKWRTSDKSEAAYYRPPIKEQNGLFKVADYYVDGSLQMEAFSTDSEKDVWQGKVTWYNKDGSMLRQGNYKKGLLDGESITFLNGQRLTAQYQNNHFVSGKESFTGFYRENRADTLVSIYYGTDLKGIREELYSIGQQYNELTKFYGENGKFLGKRVRQSGTNSNFTGIEVQYYSNPMRVRTIRYLKYEDPRASDNYAPKGQILSKFNDDKELSKTYYNSEGKVLGTLTFSKANYGLKALNGTGIRYYPCIDGVKCHQIEQLVVYKDGSVQKDEKYHKNGQLASQIIYTDKQKSFVRSLDENGNEIAKMTYKNYAPFDGTELSANKKLIYKNGKLISETLKYHKSDAVFMVRTDSLETYFDLKGAMIGKLKVVTENNYSKPQSGKRIRIGYANKIDAIEEYEEGYVVKRTSFRDREVAEGRYERFKHEEYFKPGTYQRIRQIDFYSNGQKQRDITYEGYAEASGTFYDEKGGLLGRYDYLGKNGTRYEFFDDSDQLKEVEVSENGLQIRFKRYDYGPDALYGEINPVLVEDIDLDCCARFYDRYGKLIAEATFKDREPWSGNYYLPRTRELFTLDKGARQGRYTKYDYDSSILVEGSYKDNKKNGTFKTYDYTENLLSIEQYQNDQLEGTSTYYNIDGSEIGKMAYNAGKPMDGTRKAKLVSYGDYAIETYVKGVMTKRVEWRKDSKSITQFEKEGYSTTTVYDTKNDQKRLTYQLLEGSLNGDVAFYDTLGKELCRGTFKKGVLTAGYALMVPTYNNKHGSMIVLRRTKDFVKIRLYNSENLLLFEASERMDNISNYGYLEQVQLYVKQTRTSDFYTGEIPENLKEWLLAVGEE